METQPYISQNILEAGKDERQLCLRAKDTVLCLQPEGVLPMMAYMRKFHTKGVLFSGFRYMKGRDLGILSLRSVHLQRRQHLEI